MVVRPGMENFVSSALLDIILIKMEFAAKLNLNAKILMLKSEFAKLAIKGIK